MLSKKKFNEYCLGRTLALSPSLNLQLFTLRFSLTFLSQRRCNSATKLTKNLVEYAKLKKLRNFQCKNYGRLC